MCDLASAVLLSPSGLSRRVERLERDGLVERRRAQGDGRNIEATLTSAGRRLFRRLQTTHHEGIKELFADEFSDGELDALSELLGRLSPEATRDRLLGARHGPPYAAPKLRRVNLFVQGMRRSGTTILYDALLEDPELRCFYEPLREQKVTEWRRQRSPRGATPSPRRARCARSSGASAIPSSPSRSSTGAARASPPLEVEPGLPAALPRPAAPRCWSARPRAIKETRFSQGAELAQLDPDAALVHVVRDPRAVAASIVLGRGQRRLEMLPDADDFFADRAEAQAVVVPGDLAADDRSGRRGRDRRARRPVELLRVLVVWRLTFERTLRDGLRPASATATCWSATRTCAATPPPRSARSTPLSAARCRPRSPPGRMPT